MCRIERLEAIKDPEHVSVALSDALLSKLQRRLVPVLWVGFLFNVINRSNLAFAQIQMAPELDLSQADFGFSAGIFFISYSLMQARITRPFRPHFHTLPAAAHPAAQASRLHSWQVPSNVLTARIGARWVLAADLLLWGMCSAATGFVSDARSLATVRFVLGLAQAGYFSGSLLFLRSWFPARDAAHAVAIFMTSGAAGTIVCSLTAGIIMSSMDGVLGLGGWRWLFITQAAPPILLSFVLPCLLPATPQRAAWLTRDEREKLLCECTHPARPPPRT